MFQASEPYTGNVTTGGPAQTRNIEGGTITKVAVGPMSNNSYILRCQTTGACVVIDAAAEPATLLGLAPGPSAIVTTHSHRDHWTALAALVEATGARTFAHVLDAGDIGVSTDILLEHGSKLSVGELSAEVIHLGGHTPGSIALALQEPGGRTHLFTGDGLFPGGVGNTWGDAARFRTLLTNVTDRLFGVYGDETWVYPGHGLDTTLGAERPNLAEWAARGW